MKKALPVIFGVVALLFVVGGAVVFKSFGGKQEATPAPTKRPKLSIPANTIYVEERPYVTLRPTATREVVLTVHNQPKKAQSADFELQYSAGDKEEAAIGSFDIGAKLPFSKTILLGSKSGGGKITYHENVTGGTLVLNFYDEDYKLKNEWAYFNNAKPADSFSSRDAKFQIKSGKVLNSQSIIIIYQNPGLPEKVDKTIVAGPYSISGTSELPIGDIDLSMHVVSEKSVELLGWDGKTWKSLLSTFADSTVTAKAALLQTYVVVEK